MLKRFTFIVSTVAVIMLYLTGCTQPIQPEPGQPSSEVKLSFNYTMTGAFQKSRSRAGDFFPSKMIITDLATNKVEEREWTISIDNSTLNVVSYNQLTLAPGSYRFELVVAKGGFNYYAKSDIVEVKNGANKIALKLVPVVGEIIDSSATSSMLSTMSDLVYQFSTVQLSMIENPCLGYSINGSQEVVIKLNKTTGLAPVYLNLQPGTHPIVLNFYDGQTMLGTNTKTKEIEILPQFNYHFHQIDLYPITGMASFDVLFDSAADTTFSLKIPRQVSEVVRARDIRGVLNGKVTLKYAAHSLSSDIITVKQDASGDFTILEGTLQGVSYGQADLIVDLMVDLRDISLGIPTSYVPIARSICEGQTINEGPLKIAGQYQIFPAQTVSSSLKANLKISITNSYGGYFTGDPIDGLYYSIDKGVPQRIYNGKVDIMVDSGDRLIEFKNGDETIASYSLRIKPFESKQLNHSVTKSSKWLKSADSGIISGTPLPFDLVVGGGKTYRVRRQLRNGSNVVVAEKLNASSYGWESSLPVLTLGAREFYLGQAKADSQGKIILALRDRDEMKNSQTKKIMTLVEGASAWKELALPANFSSGDLINDSAGAVYLVDGTKIKKLNAAATGWLDYTLPIAAEFLNDYKLITTVDSPLEKLFFLKGGTGYPRYFWYQYDRAAKTMIERCSLVDLRYELLPYDMVDAGSNLYILSKKALSSSGPGGYSSFTEAFIVKKSGSGSSNFIYDKEVIKSRDNSLSLNNMVVYNSELYLSTQISNRVTPNLIRVSADGNTVDTTLSDDLPVVGAGYKAQIHITEEGRFYLYYYNETTGKSYYFIKK